MGLRLYQSRQDTVAKRESLVGIISISKISTLISIAICASNSFSLDATASTRTFLRYLGQKIT